MKVIVACVLLLGCGGGSQYPATYRTAMGAWVSFETDTDMFNKAVSDELEGSLVPSLEPFGYSEKQVRLGVFGTVVRVLGDDFQCIGMPGKCAGQDAGSFLMVSANAPCASGSAYRHEFLHRIQAFSGFTDMNHKRPEWAAVDDSSCQ